MPAFLRPHLFLILAFPMASLAAPAPPAADNKPIVAAPAFVDVVTFDVHVEGENHKMVVTTGPTLLRVDEPDDGYSVIYDPQTDHYTGLEHRNYTWWEFSWAEVRAAVETSKRYETHLQDLSNEGLNNDAPATVANAPGAPSNSVGSDNSGYVWRPTNDKKKVSGFDCVRWEGDTVSGENVQAWCTDTPQPRLQAAMTRVRAINEPMALVPIRTLVPPFVFPVYDALVKGGVTPILITWGGDRDKNRFDFVEAKTRDGQLSFFTVPKLYVKTTLITMDGLIDQKK